jgi:hypothetical protein
MARIRKPQPTLDTLFFSTPEQKVLRFLLSEPTTTFTSRTISSKLKGVRGLGGVEGIMKILNDLATLGMVDFVDNRRGVRLREDCPCIQTMKTFVSLCDLDGLKQLLLPVSSRGVLVGDRATGKSSSDSDYEIVVVSDTPEEVRKITSRYPLAKRVQLTAVDREQFHKIELGGNSMSSNLERGITLWGGV